MAQSVLGERHPRGGELTNLASSCIPGTRVLTAVRASPGRPAIDNIITYLRHPVEPGNHSQDNSALNILQRAMV